MDLADDRTADSFKITVKEFTIMPIHPGGMVEKGFSSLFQPNSCISCLLSFRIFSGRTGAGGPVIRT
jgi:hypothetical protein